MSEIDSVRLNGGMTREGIATGGPSLDAAEAAHGGRLALDQLERRPNDSSAARDLERNLGALEDAVRQSPALASRYEGLIGELRDALRTQLAPTVSLSAPASSSQSSAADEALVALRAGHPQRAARRLLGGRDRAALRSMNVSPRELDARLRNAGFSNDEVASMREALDAEIGRRFQSLVRHDGLRIVQRLEHQLDQASRGEPRAIGRLEDELFSAGGPTMLARLRRAGAEEEARALDGMMMRGDHEGARRLLAIAAGKMLPIVQEQAELIARGDEGVASHWGGAYRAFETSVQRQSTALGLHPNASASLKDASVLERAVHRSVIQTQARHQEAVETGRAVFDFAMGLAGYSGVAIARGVVERRMETVDAQRRAVSGNATIGSTREVETEEVAATARAIGTAALGSLVSGMVREAIAEAGATELLDEAIDELGDRVHERLSSLLSSRIMIPDPEFTRWLVRKTVEELMSEARGELIPDEAIERALRTTP